MTSRLMSEVFMPSVPIVTPSLMATVLNSIGVPPASRIPSLTRSARRRWLKLQGMVSTQVWATPTMGLLRSSSSKPMACNMARAPARSRPSYMVRLLCRLSCRTSVSIRSSPFQALLYTGYAADVAIGRRVAAPIGG